MAERPELRRVRAICLALPEVTERLSHGSPTWFAGKKTMVSPGSTTTTVTADSACGSRPHRACQQDMVDQEPDRFFVPPYVGHRGWLGVRLDRAPDWDEVTGIVEDAYRTVAIKRLLTQLDAAP